MPEVAEQRAIGLGHLAPHPLALGIVRLPEIDGDEPLGVPGHDLGRIVVWRVGQEIEGEPVRILGPCRQRQTEPHEGVEQMMLGQFQLLPAGEAHGVRQIRDHPVVAAGLAQAFRRIGWNQPIAGVVAGIGAEMVELTRRD